MAVHTSRPVFERLEVVETGRRRRWTEDEKLRIVAESLSGRRLVSSTARRHGISRSLLTTWRRQFRVQPQLGGEAGSGFVSGGPPGGPGQRPTGFIVDPDGDRCVARPADHRRCRCRRGGTSASSGSSVAAMIPVPSGVRVWIAAGHTDMRCGMNSLSLRIQQALRRDPHAGDLYVFRGKSGKLIKIFWYDGLGASLYAKRLEKGRFVWPATNDGVVVITPGQLGYLLEGIDWRHPQHTWRPEVAG